jgi:hypothetical protein
MSDHGDHRILYIASWQFDGQHIGKVLDTNAATIQIEQGLPRDWSGSGWDGCVGCRPLALFW